MRHPSIAALLLAFSFCLPPAHAQPALNPANEHLPWTRNATIYEVNLRQYSQPGTLKAFSADLPRLKRMGVDILWLMPVQPIGKQNRKGKLGSYYAVADYKAVNPEFGNMADLKALVKRAHAMDMKVILDWVANHTAWDNPWVKQHPDWYKKNEKGQIYPVTFTNGPEPEYWTDVVGLDFNNKALWDGMIDAMAFWVREADIDGFRCDVAGLLPVAFWNKARTELDRIKPMFMLAEWSEPELHEQAFDMTYGWDLTEVLQKVAKGQADARTLKAWVEQPPKAFPATAYRMRFTSNHDFNAWQGTDQEMYGPAYQAMAVLTFTLPGMPLVYNGQEARLVKRLEFFEKDPIQWKGYELQDFYTQLIQFKKANPALAAGQYGGPVQVLDTGNDKVFHFRRQKDGNAVQVAVNLSGATQKYSGGELAPWAWKLMTENQALAK
jgi:glycosidase